MSKSVTLLAAVALVGGTALLAQKTGSAERMNGPGSPDHTFMMKAAQGGMAEVEMGKLAKDNAENQAVKDFGQKMVDDHSKANDELKDLASKKNVTLPTDVDAKDKATHDRLANLKGAAFDKAYMRDMVADHRKDVAEFKREANSGKDPDVKAWAAKVLPTLEEHLRLAESTHRKVLGEK
jgi:putative membrane protein